MAEKVDGRHPALRPASRRVDGRLLVEVSLLSPKTVRNLGRVDIEGLHSKALASRTPGRVRIRRFGRATA